MTTILPRARNAHRTLVAWNSGALRPATAARGLLRACLAEHGIAEEQIQDALVMVTELVSNAVRHAEGPYELRIRRTSADLVVEVHDRTHHIPELTWFRSEELCPVQERRRAGGAGAPLDELVESGRGLSIVAALAVGCAGGRRTPTGKSMWFAVPVLRPVAER